MSLPWQHSDRRYNAAFYAERDASTKLAAQTVLAPMFQSLDIKSVCDVGCGVGTWLATALELGAERVRGFEGPWVKGNALAINASCIVTQDLECDVMDRERYDLVISLEVAEHLSADRAPSFVRDLTALGDAVLFSAAIPNQGGTNHINERWQSYWAELFKAQEYDAFDAVRPAIWQMSEIKWWYRQNTLVYARCGSSAAERLADSRLRDYTMMDLVHPDLFTKRTSLGTVKAIGLALSAIFRGQHQSS